MVLYGMAWYGTAWLGMVWYIREPVSAHGRFCHQYLIARSLIEKNVNFIIVVIIDVVINTIQQYNTIKCNTIQYYTIQYNMRLSHQEALVVANMDLNACQVLHDLLIAL